MDELTVYQLLNKKFGNSFRYHEKFIQELSEAISNSGEKNKLVIKLIQKLSAIQNLDNIDFGLPWLEHLKEYDNMYSLHINVQTGNYRLLFTRERNGKYFLRMFDEKSGKKQTGYARNIKIALERK